jgi:hypothetical protein
MKSCRRSCVFIGKLSLTTAFAGNHDSGRITRATSKGEPAGRTWKQRFDSRASPYSNVKVERHERRPPDHDSAAIDSAEVGVSWAARESGTPGAVANPVMPEQQAKTNFLFIPSCEVWPVAAGSQFARGTARIHRCIECHCIA